MASSKTGFLSSVPYLCALMEDAALFNWSAACESRAHVLTDIEQGQTRWNDIACMDSVRKNTLEYGLILITVCAHIKLNT